jgi:serine/threonine protein kinase
MKPQNIVYSDKTNRMNIIDFGLTVSLNDMLKLANNNANKMGIYHWSYPFEFYFLNENTYETFAKLSTNEKEQYYKQLLQEITETEMAKSARAIKSFYSFVFGDIVGSLEFKEHMSGFYRTLLTEIIPDGFTLFAKASLSSVDVYGTGIALLYLLKKTKHLLAQKIYEELYELGKNMVSAQLSKRPTTENALLKYESILTDNQIMDKYNLHFVGHNIEKGQLVPKNIKKTIENIKMDDVILKDDILDKNTVSVDMNELLPVAKKKITKKKTPKSPKKKKTSKNTQDSVKLIYAKYIL